MYMVSCVSLSYIKSALVIHFSLYCAISTPYECSKTHCASNNWPIWTQKVPKEATNFYYTLFKNILLNANFGLAKIRSVHMYVIPWMFFQRCLSVVCIQYSRVKESARDEISVQGFLSLI